MEPNKTTLEQLQTSNPIGNISTTNPALQGLFSNANQLLTDFQSKGGQLTPEIQQRIQQINDFESQKIAGIAGARSSADAKDAAGLNTGLTTATTAEKSQQQIINDLMNEFRALGNKTIEPLTPSEREMKLRSNLNTLRTERQLLPLELRQEGISAEGIGGRQIEDERVRAIQESNFLAEIGLEQDARKMKLAAIEKQADFIAKDIDLRTKAQEILDKREKEVVDSLRSLPKDSLSALKDITDSWGGLAWEDLDPESQGTIADLIKPYPGLTVRAVADALKIKKQQQVFDNAVKGRNLGGGSTDGVSPRTQAVIDNPSLFDDLTPTQKGSVIAELQTGGYDTSNLGMKGLSDTAIKEVAQTQKALSDLSDLKAIMKENVEFIGPISGFARLNPWSKARQVQSDVDRVRQTVGKALEGGVLRKEDEEKYKKILATLSDTPETAEYKIDALVSAISRDIENYKALQQASGKSLNVKESLGKKGENTEDLRTKYNY